MAGKRERMATRPAFRPLWVGVAAKVLAFSYVRACDMGVCILVFP